MTYDKTTLSDTLSQLKPVSDPWYWPFKPNFFPNYLRNHFNEVSSTYFIKIKFVLSICRTRSLMHNTCHKFGRYLYCTLHKIMFCSRHCTLADFPLICIGTAVMYTHLTARALFTILFSFISRRLIRNEMKITFFFCDKIHYLNKNSEKVIYF